MPKSKPLLSGPSRKRSQCPDCSLLTAPCSLLTAHCSLLTAHCSLLTAHCSLLTAHCSLLTAHCSLLTAHCSLISRHFLPSQPRFCEPLGHFRLLELVRELGQFAGDHGC